MVDSRYTHIIIGAGSAGCVVAARVAENPKNNVLLIEAGPDQDDLEDSPSKIHDSRRVPMQGQSETYDPRIDWNLQVSMPDALPMRVPQAKLVGGGSSINGGTALRSTKNDSQEWVRLGNHAWDFPSVLGVYEALEHDNVRSTKGPHPIERVSQDEMGRIQRAFLAGTAEIGIKQVLDLNETGAEGAGPSPVCRKGNQRVSVADTFLNPVRHRDNMTIMTDSPVDRIEFSGNRATKVVFVDGRRITALKEIIVSAGAIFSPAILQRSGIGPAKLLDRLHIQQIVDLPVGLYLSDHPCVPVIARPRKEAYKEDDYSLQCQARWSSSIRPGAIDHQLVCFSYLYAHAADTTIQQRTLSGAVTGHVSGIGCNLNKPSASGSVCITTKDPSTLPDVKIEYLGTASDRASAREIVRIGYRAITSQPMQAVLEDPIGIDQSTIASDSELDEYCRSQVTSTYHFCCSCRMASREKDGVVDQSGRVYGVENLRVCDASVIPTVPASNNMWTTVMFADRIGRSIRDAQDVGVANTVVPRL